MGLGKSAYFLMLFANFTFFKGLTGIILPASLREDLSNTEVHRSKLCEHKPQTMIHPRRSKEMKL